MLIRMMNDNTIMVSITSLKLVKAETISLIRNIFSTNQNR